MWVGVMNTEQQNSLASVLSEITQLHPVLAEYSDELRQKVAAFKETEPQETLDTSVLSWYCEPTRTP